MPSHCPACAGSCYADLPNELPRVITCPGCLDCADRDAQLYRLGDELSEAQLTIAKLTAERDALQANLEETEKDLDVQVSLRDGMSKREDWFAQDPSEQPTGKQGFGFKKAPEEKKLKEKMEEDKKAPPPPPVEYPKASEVNRIERTESTRSYLEAAHADVRELEKSARSLTSLWIMRDGYVLSPPAHELLPVLVALNTVLARPTVRKIVEEGI